MAYSKTPQFNSHQLVRLPVAGTQYPHGALEPTVGLNYKNCFPRTIEHYGTDPERVIVKRPTIIYNNVAYAPTNPSYYRGTGFAHGYTIFAVDNKVYLAGNTVAIITLYSSTSGQMPVYIEEATLAGVRYIIVLEEVSTVTNSRLHIFNLDAGSNTTIDIGFSSYGRVVFLNGYLFVAKRGTQRIYNSEVGSFSTWTLANNFLDAEMYGDNIINLGVHRNHLVAFGERSIEFFYDGAVEVGSPLVRQETYGTKVGALQNQTGNTYRRDSFINIANNLYFIGKLEDGGIGLYQIENFKVERLHNDYIDNLLSSDNSQSTAYLGLFRFDHWGEPSVVFCINYYDTSPAANVFYYFAYHIREKVWSQINFEAGEDGTLYNPLIYGGVSGNSLVGYSNLSGTPNIGVWTVSNNTQRQLTATWTTDFFDGGVDSMKHFKYVDVLGSIGDLSGNNTITLSYCKDYIPYTFTSATTISRVADQFYTTRFRNLGRARRISLRVSIAGTAPIAIKGLDIAYNLGVY
jgi:hypothetical protein